MNDEEWEIYYDLRYRTFREELNLSRGSEKNDGDTNNEHVGLYVDNLL